jgi:PKD domain
MTLERPFWAFSALLLPLTLSGCGDDNNPVGPNGLTVRCSASPSSGVAPLAVAFAVQVEGANGSTQVAVNYGDGTTGSDPNVRHVYQAPGTFTAAFNVTTRDQAASCTAGVTVAATPAPPPVTGNQPPDAVFKTNPAAAGSRIQGAAPFQVRFNMCPTVDPDGDRLLFTMDFQGDGAIDVAGSTGAECRHSVVYSPGSYRPRVCVTDITGLGGQPLHPPVCQVYDVDVN